MQDREIRARVRRIIAEEIGPHLKDSLLSTLKENVTDTIDRVMMSNGVERKGLSKQQAALFYRELCATVEDAVDDYSTIQVRDQSLRDAVRDI